MTVPPEVQDALTKSGGTNYRGQPNYKIAWSEQETYLISNGSTYEPFRICNESVWLLMKWEGAKFWGTKEEWDRENWEPSGLYTAGPYPQDGRYRVIRKLQKPVIADGVMTFEPVALSVKFVDDIFPFIRDFHDLSTEQKASLILTRDQLEKEDLARKFAASRENYRGIATPKQIKDKEEAIERWLRKRVK